MRTIFEYDRMTDEMWNAYNVKSDFFFKNFQLNELLELDKYDQSSVDKI